MKELSPLGAGALRLAQAGIPVFPMRPGGKEPLTTHGFLEATTDEAQIKSWWTRRPDANVGMPTGPRSRVFVLDLDRRPDKDGFATLSVIEATDPLPTTLTVSTAGGGEHRWFTWDERLAAASSKAGKLGPGIDWRGAGGCVVVPPSVMNGGCWQRIGDCTRPVPLPEPWIARVLAASGAAAQPTPADPGATPASDVLVEGERNAGLCSIAGAMRRLGLEPEELLPRLLAVNAVRCRPPLSHQEVQQIAASMGRYPKGRPSCDDLGNGKRFALEHASVIRYCEQLPGKWLAWIGTHWHPDATVHARKLAHQTVETMALEATTLSQNDRQELAAHAKRSRGARGISGMLSEAAPKLYVRPERLDGHPHLLSTANGELDLIGYSLGAHDPDHLITRTTSAAYRAEARCPVWEGALARALPDPEIRGFLQRAVGYSLGGPASEKILFVVHGPKDSGKSAIINAIYRMFGSYAVTTRLSTFGIGSEDSGNTPELASLAGARFVLVPEIPAGKAFATGILKQWTGGDPVSATPKYAHPITFQPQGRLWFVGNDRPSIPYEDEAAWERVRVIPFAQTIPEAERDRDFGSRISLDAVLTWAVEGRKTFDRDGLKTPAAVYAARDEYREECDPLGEFLEECCELDPRASTSSADAFDRYMTWCEIRRDKKPLTRRQFSLKMKRQGITPERNMHERLFVGVGLKPSVG